MDNTPSSFEVSESSRHRITTVIPTATLESLRNLGRSERSVGFFEDTNNGIRSGQLLPTSVILHRLGTTPTGDGECQPSTFQF